MMSTPASPVTPDTDRSTQPLAISMSGCGFLGAYHFGAMSCFIRHGTKMLQRVVRYSGCSAGSLVAALCALCPDKLPDGLNVLYRLADEVNAMPFGALTPGFAISEHLQAVVADFLPEDISSAKGRLYVSVTRQRDKTNILVSDFTGRDHLLLHLIASCYIPMYSVGAGGSPPLIDGEVYVDGAFSSNLPKFADIRTITISPFSGEAEISPRDTSFFTGTAFDWNMRFANQEMKVNMKNIWRGAHALFPPKRTALQTYYEMGFRDAMQFLINEGWFERMEGTPIDAVVYAESPRSAVFL
uniref:PNPLA domain-containing protein n=1 Tax=Plectus sambesii TaxID=2011161 RepID=A0A914WTH2_9BILA